MRRRPSTRVARQSSASAWSKRTSSSDSRADGPARRIMMRRKSSPPPRGAACRQGSFRKCARSAGSPIRSIAFHWDFSDTGLFGFYAGSADRDVPDVVAASIDCLAEAAHRISEAEIRRAKAQMKVALVTALESPGARVHQLSRQMQVYGRPLPLDEVLQRVDAVAVEDVRKTASVMLRSTPTVAAIGAIGKAPGQADIAARLRGV